MDEKNFIATCKEFLPDLPITLQSLKNPTAEFVVNFYKQVLEELGADLQNLHQIQSSQLRGNSNLEMHQELVPVLNLCKSIQYIFNCIGCSRLDFGMNDLLEPTSKRNLKLMASMMNFLLYCDGEIANISPKFKEIMDKKQIYEKLVEKRNELLKKVNQQSTDRARRLEEMKELHSINKVLKNKLTELSVECNDKKALQKEAKTKLKDEERGLEKAAYAVKTLTGELSDLKSLIVKSPEELQDQFNKLVEEKNEAKVKIDNLREQIEPKKKTVEKLSAQMEAQEIRTRDLNEIIELSKTIQELKLEITRQKKKKEAAEENSEDSHARLKTLEKQLADVKEQLVGLEVQWNQQQRALNETLKTAEKEYNETVDKFDENEMKVKKLKRDIEKAQNDIDELKAKFDETMLEGKAAKKVFKTKTENFMNKFSSKIENFEALKENL